MAHSPKPVVYGITATIIAIFLVLSTFWASPDEYLNSRQGNATTPELSLQESGASSPHAFCVFLRELEAKPKKGEEDHYFTSTRMLIYQLLHDPETRTNTSIDFVVMVANNVPKEKQDRLRRDGAIVTQVEEIRIDWIKPRRSRRNHVLDKLHAWEMVQYEKVLLLDADTVVTRRLDSLFDEIEAQPLPNGGNDGWARDDEAPQPTGYLMAGNSGPTSPEHDYPAPRGNRLNAGFVLLKPGIAMYDHYMSVANIKDRFDSSEYTTESPLCTWSERPANPFAESPEQNLWNYVHRRKDGNMPWQQISSDWTANAPNYNDYKQGIASFHEKYWACERDPELRNVLLRSRWKMEGFFKACGDAL